MGAWFAISGHFLLRDYVFDMATKLIEAKWENLKKLGWISFALLLASLALQIANY